MENAVRKTIGLTCLVMGTLACTGCHTQTQQAVVKTIVLDGSDSGHTFYGIGAVSAGASSRLLIDYPEPERSQILDYLFKPDYGASLQHLKVEIGADVNSTDGSEPSYARTPDDHNFMRGYEWWLMQQAHDRNPHIVLDSLPWGAPGWVGKFYSQKTAGYIAGFVKGAQDKYGLDVAYTGVWNETPFNADYVKMLRAALDKQHPGTNIVCCDEYPGEGGGQWKIVDAMQSDQALAKDVAVVSVHYPRKNGQVTTPPEARTIGKPLWSSEDQPASSASKIHSRDWAVGGRELAQLYNDNYLQGGFTATEIWSPITSYYDNLAAPNSGLMYANTPWSGHYDVQGAIWATAHTTQFTQPGWRYLDAACGYLLDKGDYVTLAAPKGGDWSIILQTIDATQAQRLAFTVKPGLKTGVVHIWETNSSKTFSHVADVSVNNGAFAYTFDPDSLYTLTTTTGQSKGDAAPPPSAPFPFPYRENFDQVPLNGTPHYLSDQDGAFEAYACVDRAGRCLEQVITQKPIPWGPLPDPWTLAGNAQWTDYSLRADVHFMGTGAVTLIGRIDSADVFSDQKALYPSGYVLQIKSNGDWTLLSSEYKKPTLTLAHGRLAAAGAGWRTVELRFKGAQIQALLDGKALASVQDSAHTHGMIGIGTGWNRAQFDNLSVSAQ